MTWYSVGLVYGWSTVDCVEECRSTSLPRMEEFYFSVFVPTSEFKSQTKSATSLQETSLPPSISLFN